MFKRSVSTNTRLHLHLHTHRCRRIKRVSAKLSPHHLKEILIGVISVHSHTHIHTHAQVSSNRMEKKLQKEFHAIKCNIPFAQFYLLIQWEQFEVQCVGQVCFKMQSGGEFNDQLTKLRPPLNNHTLYAYI